RHWRERAEEARTRADQIAEPQSKNAMLRVAHDYEILAERAEARASGSSTLLVPQNGPSDWGNWPNLPSQFIRTCCAMAAGSSWPMTASIPARYSLDRKGSGAGNSLSRLCLTTA